MNDSKKRERSCNFAKREIRLLIDLVKIFQPIIENKKTDMVTNKNKESAWNKIATSFNSAAIGHTHRSAKTLKLKYEGIKKLTKKRLLSQKQEGDNLSSDLNQEVFDAIASAEYSDSSTDSENYREIPTLNTPTLEIPPLETPSTWHTPIPIPVTNGPSISTVECEVDPPTTTTTYNIDDTLRHESLELVRLRIELAKREHEFVRQQHEMKMEQLRNEERRQQEKHELMMNKLQYCSCSRNIKTE